MKRYAQLRIEPSALMLMLMFGMILSSTVVYSYFDPAFSFSSPSSNIVQGKEVPSIMGVKITYPSLGLRVTAGSPLIIFAVLSCNFGSIVLTKYHSVNITGVDSSPQPPPTYATDNIQNSNRVTEIEKETHTQKFSQETKNNHADPFLFVMPNPNNNTVMSKTPFQSSKSNLYDKRQLKESVSMEPAN